MTPLEPCGRRVGKLYLAGRYSGCRACHGLTYASRNESHQAERFERMAARWEAELEL